MLAPLAAREWISSNGSVFNVEVLIQVLSVTPDIALEKFNTLLCPEIPELHWRASCSQSLE